MKKWVGVLVLLVTAVGVTWTISRDVATQEETPSQSSPSTATDEPSTNEPATDDSSRSVFSWPVVVLLSVVFLAPFLGTALLEFVEALKVKWSPGPPRSPSN